MPATQYSRYTLKMSRLGTVSGSKASSDNDNWITNQRDACSSFSSSCVNARTVCVLSRSGKGVLSLCTGPGAGAAALMGGTPATTGLGWGARSESLCSTLSTGGATTGGATTAGMTDSGGFAAGMRTDTFCSTVSTGGEATGGAIAAAGLTMGWAGTIAAAGDGGMMAAAGFAMGCAGTIAAAGFAAGDGAAFGCRLAMARRSSASAVAVNAPG